MITHWSLQVAGSNNPFNYKYFYRPQTKCAKVIFLHLSVSHSVHRGCGVCLSACWDTPPGRHPPHPQGADTLPGADTPQEQISVPPSPWEQTPPAQCMLGDTGNKRAVRILLECILVVTEFSENIEGKLKCLPEKCVEKYSSASNAQPAHFASASGVPCLPSFSKTHYRDES